MVGHELLLNVGALCNVVRSTVAVNCPSPLELTSRHGIAVSCWPEEMPVGVEIPGVVVVVPLPLEVEVPLELLFTESTANWIWPLLGSTMRSRTCPRLSPVWLFKFPFINWLKRTGSPARAVEVLDGTP